MINEAVLNIISIACLQNNAEWILELWSPSRGS